MVKSLRAVLSTSLTIYRWQSAAKSVPQRVTAPPPRPIPHRKSKKALGAPPSIIKGGPPWRWVLKVSESSAQSFPKSAKSHPLNLFGTFPWSFHLSQFFFETVPAQASRRFPRL
jgi:hypothetical protein